MGDCLLLLQAGVFGNGDATYSSHCRDASPSYTPDVNEYATYGNHHASCNRCVVRIWPGLLVCKAQLGLVPVRTIRKSNNRQG